MVNSITEEDQILYILGGVGLEFDSVVVHVTSRVDELSLSEVGALFLAHEGRLDAYNVTGENSSPIINNTTFSHPKKSEGSSQSSGSFFQSQGSNQRSRGRGINGRGGRRGWQQYNGRPVCQICGVPGHVAEICYYRFDKEFVPKPTGGFRPPPQTNRSSNSYPAAALSTTRSEPGSEDWWYPDSGASHHVTNDFSNLSIGSDYSGGGKVHMGNGTVCQ